MRRSLRQTTFTFALLIALVIAVVSACGTNTSGGLPAAGGSSSGASDDDGGGGSSGCSGFCPNSSGGGASSGIYMGSGSDGGTIGPAPVMTNSVVTIDNCPGSLSSTMVKALEGAAATSGSGMKMLYPYDQTVFPGGIPAPTLQWSQTGTPDGVYVHLTSQLFNYQGCFAGASPTNFTLATTPWQTAWSQSKGTSDPLLVEIATSTGGTIASVSTHWIFAKGSLAGDVYYNTYGSKLVPGQTNVSNGAVMRIAQGATAPTAFLYTATGVSPFGPCVSCHSLSSNGSYLVAQQHMYPGGLNGKGSMSFDLVTNPMPNPTAPLASTLNDDWGFSGMYPDGTLLLTAGEAQNTATNPVFPGVAGNNPGMLGPKPNMLYDTTTGTGTAAVGLDTDYAMMPSFSVDGNFLVYNDNPGGDAGLEAGGKLAIANFSKSSMAFSNPKTLYTNDTLYPGWPFFTPDDKDVIFALGNGDNFATEVPPTPLPNQLWSSYLYIVDVPSGTSHRLDQLSGFNSAGTEYLPFPGRDEGFDFYPTINPIASGGYFWVFFTSRRAYGNVYQGSPSTGVGGNEADPGTKAIWVAAIDIAPMAGTDPSHPAFYLPGQEVGSGNIRAFPVLAPCSSNGATCETGLDCCGGSCTSGKCGVPTGCANDSDKCSATIPCCDHSEQCLGGYCSTPTPQ
jgi:hypothetical protein